MDKEIYLIFESIIQYAEEECKIWMECVPKTHANRELVEAAKMTQKIKKAKKWLIENE